MKILILELKSVCYNSYIYFAESLAKEFLKNGHEVEFFRVPEEPFENLEKYKGLSFDAIIDFNSDIPRAILDDDSYFLNSIDAPFVDIILDHPLYHHDSLKHKINNFNVICLDYKHKEYITKYYPHIKNIFVTSMTGELAFGEDMIDWDKWEQRPYDITFSGSYTNPAIIKESISKLPDELQECINLAIDILLKNTSETIENAVDIIAQIEDYDFIKTNPAIFTQILYLADAYVRCINRHNLVLSLDNCEKEIHLFGPLWEEMNLKHAIIHRELPFNLSFTIFNKSKICVNLQPNFKAGAHDRIFSAQLNGAVAFTDPSSMILEEYKDTKNILLFSLDDFSSIPAKLDTALSDTEKLKKIAQAGNEIASKHHTWTNIYNVVISTIKNVN